MFENFMHKFVHWLDPKLEKFRAPKPTPKPTKYTPKSLEDFISVLQRTPRSILSDRDRNRIAAIMSFDDRTIGELMVQKSRMVFVNAKDVLGPLTLDKLYKSGFTNFPVVDHYDKVKGIIHTEALNALEIKKTDRAEKYMDRHVNYLHQNDSLGHAIEEIERTNSYYFLVLDSNESLAGFFTIQMLLDYLLG
ncbi:CBS domain-containing protein [Candidatus Saccharibacteria bacterium]|nr:CBS domain-containing protein [Candidatus Saccharibacteria bacterium]